jgi:hypothetical protein
VIIMAKKTETLKKELDAAEKALQDAQIASGEAEKAFNDAEAGEAKDTAKAAHAEALTAQEKAQEAFDTAKATYEERLVEDAKPSHVVSKKVKALSCAKGVKLPGEGITPADVGGEDNFKALLEEEKIEAVK